MTDDQGYNGWKNYETWSVALIIDNDQALQAEAYEIAQDAASEAGPVADAFIYHTAERFKNWVEAASSDAVDVQRFNPEPWNYLWMQLIGAALSEVDWYEVAQHYLSEQVEA